MGVTIGSDARLGITSGGNLTLGKQYSDAPVGSNNDATQDTTYTWLKNDVQFQVPLGDLIVTGSGNSVERTALGEFSITGPTASTSYVVGIPLNKFLNRTYAGVPHGFLLKSIYLWYLIGAVDLTAHTFTLNTETMIGGAARAASTSFGGTLTQVTNGAAAAAISALPVTQTANLYLTQVILGTPAFNNTSLQQVTAEWTMGTGASTGTMKIAGITVAGSYGVY